MKPQVYKDERPAEHFTRFHERVRRGPPDMMHEIVKIVLTPVLMLFYRTRCIDSQNVPPAGPAIVAPNHFSFFDHFFIAVYLRRRVQFSSRHGPLADGLYAERHLAVLHSVSGEAVCR